MKSLFLFILLQLNSSIVGYWSGKLNVGGQELEICFDIASSDNGGYAATLDSPSQGATGIPVDSVTFAGTKLHLKILRLGAEYDGVVMVNNCYGEFRQSGSAFPLSLTKIRNEERYRRPQTPKPPFPYKSEEVRFINHKDGNALAGTITLPSGEGPFPAVVLVSGSGAQNRDEELFYHHPFAVIADYLTRHGIAVLRYDDRGVGGSDPGNNEDTSENYSYDAEAAFDYLMSLPAIDNAKVGILGHSEGGYINFMVAQRRPDVAFVISLAGPAVKGSEILAAQQQALLKSSGYPQSVLDIYSRISQVLNSVMEKHHSPDGDFKTELTDRLSGLGLSQEESAEMVKTYANPWMFFFLRYDPQPAIVSTKCPALMMFGTKDLQVLCSQNKAAMENLQSNVHFDHLTVKQFDGLNHLFQHAETGNTSEYVNIEETIAPQVLEFIRDWISAN